MARGYRRLSPADVDEIWVRMRAGHAAKPTARQLGLSSGTVRAYLVRCGGIRPDPRRRSPGRLSLVEREEISRGLAPGASLRAIAAWLGRSASTVSREFAAHGGRDRSRATAADQQAWSRATRPKACKLAASPAKAEDRAVPGHWEGDLVFGKHMSPVATLVERSTRFVMLVALPGGNHKADVVADALATAVQRLPSQLAKTLTWDQGHEMAQHDRFTAATGIEVYFCDPKSPWQRGSNVNTNGLLRQYLPKRLDFRTLTQADFDAIAQELNERPRQTLGFKTPSQALAEVLR